MMANKHAKKVSVPSLTEIQSERKRIRRGTYYRQALRGTVSVLLVVAAVAVLITTLFLPILQISGDSMSPTLEHDEIVVLLKTKKFDILKAAYKREYVKWQQLKSEVETLEERKNQLLREGINDGQ